MQMVLKPYRNDYPITLTVGEVYVFCGVRYKRNFLTNTPDADYKVTAAYIEHVVKFGAETLITTEMLSNPYEHVDTIKFIQAYGTLKSVEETSETWRKLEIEYWKDVQRGIG